MTITPDQALTSLGNISFKLFSTQVNFLIQALPIEERIEFIQVRDRYRLTFLDLRNKSLLQSAANFATFAPQLESGINNLQGEINALQSTVGILNGIASLLNTIGQLIGLIV